MFGHKQRLPLSPRAIALLTVIAYPAVAQGADTWSDPYPGVRLLRRNTATLRAFLAQIDLCQPGITVRATQSTERGRTVPSFGNLVGAEVAINGDFFGSGYDPSGMAIGEGGQWTDGTDNASEGSLVFGPDRAELIAPSEVVATAPAWMRQLVSGRPQLVREGTALSGFTDPSHCPIRRARTAAGFSADRRTLYLGVVDETGGSSGMTCAEMATFMQQLGAWDALNLDGGGSSTIWTAANGTLNSPSDGSPRTVANHLGIFATGAGAASHCPDGRSEVVLQGIVGGAAKTDLDGDGRADGCARTTTGIECALARDDGLLEVIHGPDWSDATGWNAEPYFSTIRMGDINGDGLADLCARSAAGIVCYPSTGAGFGAAIDGPPLVDAQGWNAEQYYSTIVLADVNGDGRDDVCARAAAGFSCWPATGTGFGDPITGPALADDSGWADRSNYGTIRMGDVNGDGMADVCARANAGMRCWLSEGQAFSESFVGPEWSDATGWNLARYYATIVLADINADARADLCARNATDYRCYLSQGDSFGDAIVGPPLSDASGWNGYDNYSTIRLADIDADGLLDVCARANAGLRCWRFLGDAFAAEQVASSALADADGWSEERMFRTIRFGDVTGDGRADLCARSAAGLQCWPSTGSSFADAMAGPAWSDVAGFTAPSSYATIRLGPPRCTPAPELCNGRDDDCDGEVDEDCGAGGNAAGGSGATGGANQGGMGATTAGGPSGSVPAGTEEGDCGCTVPGRRRPIGPSAVIFALAVPLVRRARRSRAARHPVAE